MIPPFIECDEEILTIWEELERRLAQAAPQAPILIEASDELLLQGAFVSI